MQAFTNSEKKQAREHLERKIIIIIIIIRGTPRTVNYISLYSNTKNAMDSTS